MAFREDHRPARLHPQRLVRIPEPLNDPAWLWELKLDGFRALAYLEDGQCRLISRTGHVYKSFEPLRAGGLLKDLKVKSEPPQARPNAFQG